MNYPGLSLLTALTVIGSYITTLPHAEDSLRAFADSGLAPHSVLYLLVNRSNPAANTTTNITNLEVILEMYLENFPVWLLYSHYKASSNSPVRVLIT